jgi:8-oxo-dGTP diphosphatase
LPFTYPYPRPAVTVDVVLFAIVGGDLAVLLVKRGHPPFAGTWALPGGFVDENEPLAKAALRELREETGVRRVTIDQLGAFGDPGRDPRAHTVSVAYLGFAAAEAHPAVAGDDAAEAVWQPMAKVGGRGRGALKLAFDHADIIALARRRMVSMLRDPASHPVARALLPARFTLLELQRVYEAVLGRKLVSRDFRAQLDELGLVEPVGSPRVPAPRRASRLHRWRQGRGLLLGTS